MRVGFLFNHYLTYQVLHGAPFAFELSRRFPNIQVVMLCSSPENYTEVERIGTLYPGHKCTLILLKQSNFIDSFRVNFHILHRPFTLLANKKLLASFDALIAPEKNYIMLKMFPAFSNTLFIGLRHGAGDRPVSFNKGSLKFDYLLVPGQAYFERFKDELPDGCCEIVGYPKFEVLEKTQPDTPRLFENDRPTVLYAPHFHRKQSSWISLGRQVLSFFAKSSTYNLIFAPHARLFKHKKYHDNIDLNEFRDTPNILIDTGSERSFDMTYTRAADIYLGDVSSQVCEFIYYRRRPCVFLNPNLLDQNTMNFWRFGPVTNTINELDNTIEYATNKLEDIYKSEQDVYVDSAFSSSDVPPSQRGAEAIARALKI